MLQSFNFFFFDWRLNSSPDFYATYFSLGFWATKQQKLGGGHISPLLCKTIESSFPCVIGNGTAAMFR